MGEVALYARADGLFEPRHPKAVELCKANAGKMFIADISMEPRTALQGRYLNGWIYRRQICAKLNEAGITGPGGVMWTRDLIHEVMQEQFLVIYEFEFMGKIHKRYESTAKMSKKRFSQYINDQVRPFVWSLWEIQVDDPRQGFYWELYRELSR